jgi:hypothetical protein
MGEEAVDAKGKIRSKVWNYFERQVRQLLEGVCLK